MPCTSGSRARMATFSRLPPLSRVAWRCGCCPSMASSARKTAPGCSTWSCARGAGGRCASC
eukprot:488179-Lingulodinium_polyedra.AAC.1